MQFKTDETNNSSKPQLNSNNYCHQLNAVIDSLNELENS